MWRLCSLLALVGCDAVFLQEQQQPCPAIYDLTFVASGSSYYYVVERPDSFASQRVICRSHGMGAHLAKIDTIEEAAALDAHLDALRPNPAEPYIWIGLVQSSDARTPDELWEWTVGGEVAVGLWAPSEPDDMDNDETVAGTHQDHGTLFLDAVGGFLNDRAGGKSFPAMCECDGLLEL